VFAGANPVVVAPLPPAPKAVPLPVLNPEPMVVVPAAPKVGTDPAFAPNPVLGADVPNAVLVLVPKPFPAAVVLFGAPNPDDPPNPDVAAGVADPNGELAAPPKLVELGIEFGAPKLGADAVC
jgi:hypothetical protein